MTRGPNLGRLTKTLRRHAGGGWQRAVFSYPANSTPTSGSAPAQASHEPQVLEGPAPVQDLVDAAVTAARTGRVKQVLVVDARTRIRIDARYGKAKIDVLDDDKRSKVTGGKPRALQPDTSADLLRVIGIANADGTISAKAAKKYKQVNHFVELCRPVWTRLLAHRAPTLDQPLRVLDLACGNSYLTFVLAEALRLAQVPAALHGVDVRPDLVDNCQQRAAALDWPHMTFSAARIESFELDHVPDLLLALHACDTATDAALACGVRNRVAALMVAPCCQRELAAQLAERPAERPPAERPFDNGDRHFELGALVTHGLLRREYAATLTDALRVELLDAHGYRVDVVEFVDSAHSAKNVLLRAHRRPGRDGHVSRRAIEAWLGRCSALGVQPTLGKLLEL